MAKKFYDIILPMKTKNYMLDKNLDFSQINFTKYKTKKNLLVQIFCGQGIDDFKHIIKNLSSNLPNACIIGSSTDGEIFEEEVSVFKTIVSISYFEKTTLNINHVNSCSSSEDGEKLTKNLIKDNTKLLILFTIGRSSNIEPFLKGIENIDKKVPICGGFAGNNGDLEHTFICVNKKVLKKGAVAISLNSTHLKVINDYKFNWHTIGVEHTITSVNKNRVYTIDNIKAYDFYKKYLGKEVSGKLPISGIEFPLVINKGNLFLARTVVKKHKDKSLTFSGNLNHKDKVKLAFGDVQTILKDSPNFFKKLNKSPVESFFIYSCMARRRFMPKNIYKETKSFSKIAPTCGFFTYGEFYHFNKKNELLNHCLTIVALSESTNKTNIKKINVRQNIPVNEKHLTTIKVLTNLIENSSKDYLSQTKKLEKQKEYSQNILNMQKNFIRQTIHETNTPLSVIINAVELSKMNYGENRYLSHIEAAMKNLSNIYNDLSYLLKQEQITYESYTINIVDYVRSRIDFFKLLANEVRLDFSLDYDFKDIFIKINESKLQRIIDNNITNAIKYSIENSLIKISIKKQNSFCILEFSSHSHKIKNTHKIFEEFYQESYEKKGFGLGLNLVKKICDEENIQIKTSSSKLRTTFIYKFKLEEII